MSDKHIMLDSDIKLVLGTVKLLKRLTDDYLKRFHNKSELHNIIENTYQGLSIQFRGVIISLEHCIKDFEDSIIVKKK